MGSIRGYSWQRGDERSYGPTPHVYRVKVTWTDDDGTDRSYFTDLFGTAAKAKEAATKFCNPRRRWRYTGSDEPPLPVYTKQLQRATLCWDAEQPATWTAAA